MEKAAFRSRAVWCARIQIQAVNSWRCAQQVAAKVTLSLLSPRHARLMAHSPFLYLTKTQTMILLCEARSETTCKIQKNPLSSAKKLSKVTTEEVCINPCSNKYLLSLYTLCVAFVSCVTVTAFFKNLSAHSSVC